MTGGKMKKMIPLIIGAVLAVLLIAVSAVLLGRWSNPKRGYDVVIFGDSLMAYVQDDTSVANMLAAKTGLTVGDFSFGGTLMSLNSANATLASHRNSFSMYALAQALLSADFTVQRNARVTDPATDYFHERAELLEHLDLKKTDIVIIEQCLNDYHCAIPVGDENSVSCYTYCGALKGTVEMLRRINPDIRIIIVSPTEKWMLDGTNASDYDYGGGILDDYIEAQKKTAEALGVEYLSMYELYKEVSPVWTDEETGEPVVGSGYTVEGTHPNYYGRDAISSLLADYLK